MWRCKKSRGGQHGACNNAASRGCALAGHTHICQRFYLRRYVCVYEHTTRRVSSRPLPQVVTTRARSQKVGRIQDSPVGIATGYLLAGRPRFDSRQGQKNVLSSTASSPALGTTQPPIHWVSEAFFFPGVWR
jgi:hypothetical protein